MIDKRRSARAPILTQVEAQGEKLSALGRAKDISVGGLLIETPDTLPVSAAVIVRFFLPGESQPIEAAGRVSRTEPGKLMVVSFLGLPRPQEEKIVAYIKKLQQAPAADMPLAAGQPLSILRRSARLQKRLAVILTWKEEGGRSRQEAAETFDISRYGALLHTFSELHPGQLLRLTALEISKEAASRVVRIVAVPVPGRVGAAVEFLGESDFWGIEFPSDKLPAPDGPKIARRRSARLPRSIEVTLNWLDEAGQFRQEKGQTREVSQYGAAVTFPVALRAHQFCRLRVPLIDREVESHIVWSRRPDTAAQAALGIEFLGKQDLWGHGFPPDPGSVMM